MSPEQFVAVLGAFTALIAAVGAVLVQSRATHQLVNSRMTQLLELVATSNFNAGQRGETIINPEKPLLGAVSTAQPLGPPPQSA